jgi:hypothetical protein
MPYLLGVPAAESRDEAVAYEVDPRIPLEDAPGKPQSSPRKILHGLERVSPGEA